MYYPREEKLVSLDVLKLYQGEDLDCQNPEDVDPDCWLDGGKLTELAEVPREEIEVVGIKCLILKIKCIYFTNTKDVRFLKFYM